MHSVGITVAVAINNERPSYSWARTVVFGLSLDLHVLPYFVDYSRTGSGCALEQARLSLYGWQT